MAKIEDLTADVMANSCAKVSGISEKVGEDYPLGKENVAKCIKNIGQYIIDNAEKFAENIDRTVSIDIDCNISANELPEVQVIYTNRIKCENIATTEE